MRSKDWKDIAELFGIAAIVASLLFVGLQMRQTQEIALSAAYQARADTSLVIRTIPLESPALLSALTKSWSGQSDQRTPEEQTAENFWFASNLIYLENVHYQYLNGFVAEEQWRSNVGDLKLLFETPSLRGTWEQGFGSWRDSFLAEIQDVIDEIDSESPSPE